MVRIMDAAVYMRPCQGGLLWGVFEEAPRFLDMQSLGANFDIMDTPLDNGRRADDHREIGGTFPPEFCTA